MRIRLGVLLGEWLLGILLLCIMLIDPVLYHASVGELFCTIFFIEPDIVRVWVVEEKQNLKCMESEASMENLSNCHLLIKNEVPIEA